MQIDVQVKSSQVKWFKFKMAVANPPPLVPTAGASDREGRSWRNRHHWIAPSRGIIPIVFILIIAAPQGFNNMPFSGSLLYGNATWLQADDGSDRGPARGLFRWAKVSIGSGDRRRRASSARGPSPTSLGVLGQTRARQSFLGPDKSGWRGGGKSDRRHALRQCAPPPAHAPYLTSHVCARETQVPAPLGAAANVLAQERERERAAERGGSATAQAAAAARHLGERTRATAAKGAVSQVHRQDAARREHRSEHARQLSPALPFGV